MESAEHLNKLEKKKEGEFIMNKLEIERELNIRYHKARSAWERGIILYASEILNNIQDDGEVTEKHLLNGACDWKEYSEGGCSLIYDEDICHRLCTPSEIKRKRGGELPPNSHETWLDVQARALYQAADMIIRIAGGIKHDKI